VIVHRLRSHNFFETFFTPVAPSTRVRQCGLWRRHQIRASDSTCAVFPGGGSLCAAGLRIIRVHQSFSRFRSSFLQHGLGNVSRAKIRPPRIYFHRRIVDPWGVLFWPSTCTCNQRDTARIQQELRQRFADLKNWTHERYAMEWFEAQWHTIAQGTTALAATFSRRKFCLRIAFFSFLGRLLISSLVNPSVVWRRLDGNGDCRIYGGERPESIQISR